MEILQGKTYRNIPVHNNLRELFKTAVSKFKNKTAYKWRPILTQKEPVSITYEQMDKDIDALQTALYDPQIEQRKIALVGVNSYHWCISYNATVFGLGFSIPMDQLLTATELVNLLKRSEADTIICDARFIEMLAPHMDELSFVKHKICMLKPRTSDKQMQKLEMLMTQYGFIDMESMLAKGYELIEAGKGFNPPEIFPDTQAVLLFTSGTTSDAKGVILSHYNITSNAAGMERVLNFEEDLVYLSILPLHHCLENTCGFHTIIALGGTICVCDGLRYINSNLQEYKPNLLIGVPSLYDSFYKKIQIALRKQNKEKQFNKARKASKILRKIGIDVRRKMFKAVLEQFGGNLKYCISGAAAQRRDVIEFFDEIGVSIYQGFGLSECAPVVTGCNTETNPIGTCGHPIGGLTIAIDNDKPGQDGEILIKINEYPNHKPGWKNEVPTTVKPNDLHIVMDGYYQNDEANETVFAVDGWLRTMDIGHIDPKTKGLVITGRAKSMIVLNTGKKVFPEEIESKLNVIDLIADSLVWGEEGHNHDTALIARLVIDQEIFDETKAKLIADGVAEEDIQGEIEDMISKEIQRINSEMIKFKRIRHFFYSTEDIIKTTTRKIKRLPEVNHIHEFFATKDIKGIDFSIHNLDDIGFIEYSKEVK